MICDKISDSNMDGSKFSIVLQLKHKLFYMTELPYLSKILFVLSQSVGMLIIIVKCLTINILNVEFKFIFLTR